ncbi:hypothetical protein StoSoilB3_11450 [Arthrobacter sp. StoSoilB3]|nr:hypothetical protein StoSoilB3_11450 [Arthrobacter sp. StoSoilB3]
MEPCRSAAYVWSRWGYPPDTGIPAPEAQKNHMAGFPTLGIEIPKLGGPGRGLVRKEHEIRCWVGPL